jgi:hypothetical protein
LFLSFSILASFSSCSILFFSNCSISFLASAWLGSKRLIMAVFDFSTFSIFVVLRFFDGPGCSLSLEFDVIDLLVIVGVVVAMVVVVVEVLPVVGKVLVVVGEVLPVVEEVVVVAVAVLPVV